MDETRCLRPYAAWTRLSSVHGRHVFIFLDSVSQATGPIHVSDSINTASPRQSKGCRQLIKVNETAVNPSQNRHQPVLFKSKTLIQA